MPPKPLGWIENVGDADTYFEEHRLETAHWDNLQDPGASDPEQKKAKALWNAYHRLFFDPHYSFPPSPTLAQFEKLEIAQCEMAYYLAEHLADEDRRKGIQAQGTIKADVVGEQYDPGWLDKIPVPPFVDKLLSEFKTGGPLHVANVARDEDEDADEKVHDF